MFGRTTLKNIVMAMALACTMVRANAVVQPAGDSLVSKRDDSDDMKGTKYQDVSARYNAKSEKARKIGEDHGKNHIPDDAKLTTLKLKGENTKLALYWSAKTDPKRATHAFVMIHGKLRDGYHYWTVMNDAWKSAMDDNYRGVSPNTLIIAPEFYSTEQNKGQYDNETLAWDDVNAWQAGMQATHPKSTNATAIDALDRLLYELSDLDKYPKLNNMTIVAHGGGAQLLNRYAAVGGDPEDKHLHVRYIIGDPSSSPYFTKDRPLTHGKAANKSDCPLYNSWRYGFEDFPGTLLGNKSPKHYYSKYVSRDIVNIVGYKDTSKNGDQKCMAVLQGGHRRRDRNLAWWRYINMLGRTNENLHGFPGNFSDLPDWSDVTNGVIRTRLSVAEDATHDPARVFKSKVGRAALFSHDDVEQGWRPDGWKYQPPKNNSQFPDRVKHNKSKYDVNKPSSKSSSSTSSSKSSSSTSS